MEVLAEKGGEMKKAPLGPFLSVLSPAALQQFNQPFVVGEVSTPKGAVPQVSSRLTFRDHWGTFKARWGIRRMDYKIVPGLYALGNPDKESPVVVTANYKMSFDKLRGALGNHDAWILVLDTKGINVWCAAGKGTFGTEELIFRLKITGLEKIVHHRNLILPQLAAPGVSAHEVKKQSGFTVHYGPIKATDLPLYLKRGLRATPEMRQKTFSFLERLVLVPIELIKALQIVFIAALLLLLLGLIRNKGAFNMTDPHNVFLPILSLLWSVLWGAVLFPLFLPFLPGRAFSTKGIFLGIIAVTVFSLISLNYIDSTIENVLSLNLVMLAAITYLAMNFTGASTFTSLSGVRKEMRWALPLEIALGVFGSILWFFSFLTA